MAGSGTYDKLSGILGCDFFEGDLIIAIDGDIGALEHKVLVDIPGEGVVIVDEDEVGCCGKWFGGRRMERRMVDQVEIGHCRDLVADLLLCPHNILLCIKVIIIILLVPY